MMSDLSIKNDGIVIEPLGDKNVFKAIRKGVSLLEDYDFVYWCSAGTVLGLVREDKGWIGHDTDIDVEVLVSCNEPSIIFEQFTREGYKLVREMRYDNEVMQLAF